jgi:hypothetical protein
LAPWVLEVLLAPLVCFDVLSREKTSTSTNGAFASIFATQGLIFGKPTKKKKKEVDIKKVLNLW